MDAVKFLQERNRRWNVLLHKSGWAFVGNTKFFLLLWGKKGGTT